MCIIRTRCYQCGDIRRWSGSCRLGERNGDIKIDMTGRGEAKKGGVRVVRVKRRKYRDGG